MSDLTLNCRVRVNRGPCQGREGIVVGNKSSMWQVEFPATDPKKSSAIEDYLPEELTILDTSTTDTNPQPDATELEQLRKEVAQLKADAARDADQRAELQRKMNAAWSLVMYMRAKQKAKPVEIKTLSQMLTNALINPDEQLATHLNDGWKVMNITVNSVSYPIQSSTSGRVSDVHYRIITLSRRITDAPATPQPDVRAAVPIPVREVVPPSVPQPVRVASADPVGNPALNAVVVVDHPDYASAMQAYRRGECSMDDVKRAGNTRVRAVFQRGYSTWMGGVQR